jgi:hypothetical protein
MALAHVQNEYLEHGYGVIDGLPGRKNNFWLGVNSVSQEINPSYCSFVFFNWLSPPSPSLPVENHMYCLGTLVSWEHGAIEISASNLHLQTLSKVYTPIR